MWILIPYNEVSALQEERIQSQNLEQTLQKSFLLLPDADNVVGRLPKPFPSASSSSSPRPFRPIAISELSISGSHATLNFDRLASIDNPQNESSVTLTDRSTYGTWVNGEKVHATAKLLKEGDLMEFGGNRLVKFHLRRRPLVVTVSAVSDAVKTGLLTSVAKLGGYVISDWRRDVSTHCCMEKIAVTIKTISAMVALKPVVTPDFFHAFLTNALKEVDSSMASPEEDDFLPEVSDSQLTGRSDVSFRIRPTRADIFAGKTFYFFDRKQYKKCFNVIEIGGGKTKLKEDPEALKMSLSSLEELTRPNTVVMQPNVDSASQSFAVEVRKELEKKNLRWIDTPEIGYAVIYDSTRLYVNPAGQNPNNSQFQPPAGGQTVAAEGAAAGNVGNSAATKVAVEVEKPKLDQSSSLFHKETRMDSAPSSSPTVATVATTVSTTPAAKKRPINIFAATPDSVPPSTAVAPESVVVPSPVPSQNYLHRQPPCSSISTSNGNGAEASSSNPAASKAEASRVAASSSEASTAAKSTVRQSAVLKRILWADSDEEENEDAEVERKRKKMKMAEEEDERRKEEDERRKREEKKKEEEERRKRDLEEKEKERKNGEEEENRRREEERKRKELRAREEEDERRRLKEADEKARNRKREAEEEERKRKREAEEEEENKKRRRKSEDDFSDLDMDDVDEKFAVGLDDADGAASDEKDRRRTPVPQVENPAENVKVEAPSQPASQPGERRETASNDGWIRKTDKSRNRRTNGHCNGLSNGLTNGDHLINGVSSLSLGMMVEEVNLVVRRARTMAPVVGGGVGEEGANAEGAATPVKNFKRFKRSARRNFHVLARMVVDLVPVAMNAAPPETFQPNLASSSSLLNQTTSTTGRTANSFNQTASSFNPTVSSSVNRDRPSTSALNGRDSPTVISSNSVVNGETASSNGSSAGRGAHPNFDVDLSDDESSVDGRQNRQEPPRHQPAPTNQPADEFFDFDF